MKKYQVIGGQYEYCWKGESDTIKGAKWIATHNTEYWDNWKGFRKPSIYAAEDVEEITTDGWITMPDGITTRVPKQGAEPLF